MESVVKSTFKTVFGARTVGPFGWNPTWFLRIWAESGMWLERVKPVPWRLRATCRFFHSGVVSCVRW